jgi:hypothetical protein
MGTVRAVMLDVLGENGCEAAAWRFKLVQRLDGAIVMCMVASSPWIGR